MRCFVARVREKTARKKSAKREVSIASSSSDKATIKRLKEWRLVQAREQNLPAYVIFHDAVLEEIAVRKPTSLDQLADIPGIGKRKLEHYGEALLEVTRSESL